jgi:hypothetical protein
MELTINNCVGNEAIVTVPPRRKGRENIRFHPILETNIWWDRKVSNEALTAKQVNLEYGKRMPSCIQGKVISVSEDVPDTPELLAAMGFKEIEFYQKYQELKPSHFRWRFVDDNLSEKTVPKSASEVVVNTYGTFIK